MKQASSRELFGYWTQRRGKRAAPERGEIEPSAIRRALGDVFILEFERQGGHPFRLAGTRVCALFARELKNEQFLNLWDAPSRLGLADLLDVIADEATGVVASVSGRTAEGWAQDLELLRSLPSVRAVRSEGATIQLTVGEPHVTIPALLLHVEHTGRALSNLATRQASLEDVFVSLTGRHLRDE